jgi:hypothetical protein
MSLWSGAPYEYSRIANSLVFAAGACPLADERADLVRVWDVVSSRLGRAPSTLLGISFLGYPEQLVEIEAIASVDSRR